MKDGKHQLRSPTLISSKDGELGARRNFISHRRRYLISSKKLHDGHRMVWKLKSKQIRFGYRYNVDVV